MMKESNRYKLWQRFGSLLLTAVLILGMLPGHSASASAAATAIGAVLILMPMSASRLVFTLCGVAVLAIGGMMLLDRIQGRRWITEGDDPNIIDAL